MKILLVIFLFALQLRLVWAIYEDQAGKFDWRKQLIGCPTNVFFTKGIKGDDRLLISTRDDILASLSANTGEIVWRRILESNNDTASTSTVIATHANYLYSIVDKGRAIRSWRKDDGVLMWQKPLAEVASATADIVVFSNTIFVAVDTMIAAFSASGEFKYSLPLTGKLKWSRFLTNDGKLFHMKWVGDQLLVRTLGATKSESEAGAKSITFTRFNVEKCAVAGPRVLCAHSDTLVSIDVSQALVVENEKNTGLSIREIIGSSSFYAAVRSPSTVKVYVGLDEVFAVNCDGCEFQAVNFVDDKYLLTVATNRVAGYDLKTGKSVFEVTLNNDPKRVAAKAIFGVHFANDWELVLVGNDCRVELLAVESAKSSVNVEWTREEALSRIASVEMVDLPLSEMQQMIEDEFEGGSANFFSSFVHRIVAQIGQLQKWISRSLTQVFSLSSLLSARGNGFSDLINAVRSASSSGVDAPFERDYFNLRKVIIVSTFDGVVYGIDSSGGAVLWRFFLDSFAPLKSQLGELHIPLLVQRSTAHYQLNGQAAVVFQSSVDGTGVVVMFNPMDGSVVERVKLDEPVKKVTLLPFFNKNHVYSLIVITKSEKIAYLPETNDEILATAAPLHILDVSDDGRSVKGQKIDLLRRKLSVSWSGNLGLASSDKIISVKGKPYNQKVHSQGRVLIDRTVQYKYVNPNLAAVGALDEQHQTMTIVLIDVVSGQIVHSSLISKVSAPVHFVHSENWLAYSYWSEKGRRTEIGVVELYEGAEEQSMSEVFDSMAPTKKAPVVLAQSYIYAHGIDAMSVTETEQGLTTRSILVALPCGGIHEVSRKLLDAARPMELTPEMREEMMIGYVPEIAIATEEMINYNQTVHRVRGIKTAPSGLESTSLVLAFGTDVFFTRLAPSGTFDILKDDFDHVLITLVLAGLVIGSFVSKKFARSTALKAQWA